MKHFMGILCLALACATARGAETLNVVATTGMVADLVRNVGGDRVQVTGLIGEGVDPHLYKPTRDDVAKLLRADVVFFNGLLLEGRMEETFAKIRERGKPVVAITKGIPADRLLTEASEPDPHVWMDPELWAATVETVRETLAGADPGGAATFAANADAYRKTLAGLADYQKRVLATIPERQRVLVTAHDAFQYLARATGLRVLPIQGISTESEAGVSDINRIVDEVVAAKVPAIFVESSVPDKNVRAVLEGAAARGAAPVLGGNLFSDAMGPAGTYEGTYVGMIDHNATTLARALGGEAPPRGLDGRLAP